MLAKTGFQSTHPARGATSCPRSCKLRACISIHAPREGCDRRDLPERGHKGISIHAPREGCDHTGMCSRRQLQDFNPRTPRGVRRSQCRQRRRSNSPFQSTHPARGATPQRPPGLCHTPISIHAPREGCDDWRRRSWTTGLNFNPRTPRGVRRGSYDLPRRYPAISIHAPREGCDLPSQLQNSILTISIHAPREGCDSSFI